MAESKKRKTTKKSTASSKRKSATKKKTTRKRATAKKAPATRRRAKKKKPTKRKSSSQRKNSVEKEFAIPIHMVDTEESVAPEVDADDVSIQEHASHDQDSVAAPSLADFSAERDIKKTFSGLEKRDEKVIKKEKEPSVNLKKKKKGGAGKVILIILGILLGIGAIAAVVYAVLSSSTSSFTGENGVFTVTGPTSAVSGAEVEYTLSLQNNEQVAFQNVVFDVVYPGDFEVSESSPKASNFNQTSWELGALNPGEKTEVTVTGKLIGAQNEQKELIGRLTYRPENVSSPFTDEQIATTKIAALDTQLSVSGPQSVTAGEAFTFTITPENTIGTDLENLRIKVSYPEGFDFKSGSPRPDFGTDAFDISSLPEGESEEIEIKGVLSGDVNEKKMFTVELGFVNESNEFIPQIQEEYTVEIGEVLAMVITSIDGSQEGAALPGETVEVEVLYRNEGTETFNNARLETKFDTDLFDTDSIEVTDGAFEDSVVAWNAETSSGFEVVNPGDSGTLSFKAKLSEQILVNNKEDKNLEVSFSTIFSSDGVEGDAEKEVSIEGAAAMLRVSSQFTPDIEVRYHDFEGKKIGSGPLPPVKDKETTYRVYFTLSNTFNDVDDVAIVLQAGENIEFSGTKNTEVGTLTVNSKKLTWNVGKVPAHTGRFLQNIEAYADITFTPSTSDVGKTPDLFSVISVTGQDAFSSQVLTPEVGDLTTNISNDSFVDTNGEVQASASTSSSSSNEAEPFVAPETTDEADAIR